MPLPLAPAAAFALRAGTVALAAYAVRRSIRKGRTDQRAEDALDDMDEGIAIHSARDRDQKNAAARFRRVFRWGDRGLEIDAAAIGRIRLRRV
ncbi:hypothetical protein [Ostreiculturibacter nitratireducens]|uniref:hypothetical protein n=1 Tax=Ostreiculturibacter nitratireducens TaxID=3075226 RepID=UPI0031B5F3FE